MQPTIEQITRRPDTWRGFSSPASTKPEHYFTTTTPIAPANSDWHGVDAMPTGHTALDQVLQFGGWPLHGGCEVLCDCRGMGDMGLFLPTMRNLSEQGRWQAFIDPPHIPYAPQLAAEGIDTQHILMIHSKSREERLWATEQALRSTTCSVVFSWLGSDNYRYAELRKLQLAAVENDTLAIFFRTTDASEQHSPMSLRIQLSRYHDVLIRKQRNGRRDIQVTLDSSEVAPHAMTWQEVMNQSQAPTPYDQHAG